MRVLLLAALSMAVGLAPARRTEAEDDVAAEEAAKTERIGLWQSHIVVPWTWRVDNGIEVDWP